MAIHNLISLSNTESTLVSPSGTHSGVDITIQNVDAEAYVYIGTTDSTSSTDYGYRISPNNAIAFELPGKDSLYAISDTNGSQVGVILTNLESGS